MANHVFSLLQQYNGTDFDTHFPISTVTEVVTLTANGWVDGAQTVTCEGILADETKQVIKPEPKISSSAAYNGSYIECTGQGENTLTFTCKGTIPTVNIKVNVRIASLNLIS